nr:MAG TPA: hypothetical protein [Caudoviricetes sp.]
MAWLCLLSLRISSRAALNFFSAPGGRLDPLSTIET